MTDDLSKATPRPWYFGRLSKNHQFIDGGGEVIQWYELARVIVRADKRRSLEGEANAALIVKAVNERDEIIALMRRVDAVLQGSEPGPKGDDYLNEVGHDEMAVLRPLVHDLLAKADAP